jgi:hypothetical protein
MPSANASPWRPASLVLIATIAGLVLLAAGARVATRAPLEAPIGDGSWTGRTRAWFATRGFYRPEVDPQTGAQFSWTSGRSRLIFANLDRSQPYRLRFAFHVVRPEGAPPPDVSVAIDGVTRGRVSLTAATGDIDVDVPARRAAGMLAVIDVSNTWAPEGGEARVLGVIVDEVRLEPASGHFTVSWPTLGWAALAIAAFATGVVLCGPPLPIAIALVAAIVAGVDGLLWLDAAFIGADVLRLVTIGASVAILGAIVALLRRLAARRPALWPEWPTAAAVVIGLSAVKLACFTHPQIALTDAMFQVHRAELVHRGQYFFTSLTPAPSFEFPYAIALYVAAQPFWSWFRAELDLANLLRGLALIADALVGFAVYAVARRQWASAPAALLAAAIWPLTRAPAMALGHANLTNLFGQGLFGVAMGAFAWMAAGGAASPLALAAGAGMLTLAFLSHFSTLSIGVILTGAIAAGLIAFAGRQPALRRVGLSICAAAAIAFALAYVVYYSHFTALYRETFTRVVSGVDRASATSMVADPATKFRRWITEDQFANDYGLPGIALFVSAAIGLVWLLRRRPRDGLTIVLGAWAFVWMAASALGIFSSVELRANLAATPMFVCLAAYALGAIGRTSRWGLAVATAGLVAIAHDGVRVWLFWLGLGSS